MAGRFIALIAVLTLAGCDLGRGTPERHVATSSRAKSTAPEPTLTEPRPTRTELVVQAIRACEVKRIFIAHDDTMWITYRGGKRVPMRRLNRGLSSGQRSMQTPATSWIGIE
jgi:hypothetical protein